MKMIQVAALAPLEVVNVEKLELVPLSAEYANTVNFEQGDKFFVKSVISRRVWARRFDSAISHAKNLENAVTELMNFHLSENGVVFYVKPFVLDKNVVCYYATLRGIEDMLGSKVLSLKQQYSLPSIKGDKPFSYEKRVAILQEIRTLSTKFYNPVHTLEEMMQFIEKYGFKYEESEKHPPAEAYGVVGFTVATQHVTADSVRECLDIMMDMVN